MEFKKPKIGIVVGIRSEKRCIPSNKNLFVEIGYGKKAYKAAKNVLKNNLDLIISFGLAGSMTKKIRNSEVIIPNKILNEKFKFKKTSTISNNYLRKRSKEKIIKNVCLFTSDKILNKKIKLKISAVDMEASYVLKAASEHKVPFSSVKIIFDDMENSIPSFLINSIDNNGKIKLFSLIIAILKKPYRVKDLVKLNRIYVKSMQKLKSVANQIFKLN